MPPGPVAHAWERRELGACFFSHDRPFVQCRNISSIHTIWVVVAYIVAAATRTRVPSESSAPGTCQRSSCGFENQYFDSSRIQIGNARWLL